MIVKKAYDLLGFVDKNYDFSVKYSGRFKDFNARAEKRRSSISFSLSKLWIHHWAGFSILCSVLKVNQYKSNCLKSTYLYKKLKNVNPVDG